MDLIKLIIDSSDLTWDASSRSFTADASDLEANYPVSRLDYADGKWYLTVKSARTGSLAEFVRKEEVKDRSGELAFVKFHNREHDLYLYIIND